MTSNSYNRGKQGKSPQSHSIYDIIAANIALKIMGKYRINLTDAMRVGYFLGFFVLIFSVPYSWIKKRIFKAKINSLKKH